MKFWKKVLVLVLVVGVVWGVWGIWGKGAREQEGQKEQGGQGKAEEPIRFSVMSDIHGDWENFRKALEEVGSSFAEASAGKDIGGFVIVTGDLTTIGKKSELIEAKKILDESGI